MQAQDGLTAGVGWPDRLIEEEAPIGQIAHVLRQLATYEPRGHSTKAADSRWHPPLPPDCHALTEE